MEEITRLIAVRHGETAWNVDTRIQGQLDVGLNATGLWQAQRVGQALAHEDIGAIYASDLSRAWPGRAGWLRSPRSSIPRSGRTRVRAGQVRVAP